MTDTTTTRPAVGPELDAAVSRDVFAWQARCARSPLLHTCSRQPPAYSTDLAAAGLILERWREEAYSMDMYWLSDDLPPNRWRVTVTFAINEDVHRKTVGPTCDTLPEAIARCALLVAEAT